MKKLLLYIVVMLLLFVACGTEEPVVPEPEQPVHTEQAPVEEQPQVEVPEEPEETELPEAPEVLLPEPELPELYPYEDD